MREVRSFRYAGASEGHRRGTGGRAPPEGSGPPVPTQTRSEVGTGTGSCQPRGSSARGEEAVVGTPPAPRPAPAHWRPLQGQGEVAGAVIPWGPRLRTLCPHTLPARRPAHRLPVQHVARRCARRRGPRAPPEPPPAVGCRCPRCAGPQPAARGLLQQGEAAGRALSLRRFVFSRVRSLLGGKAPGLSLPSWELQEFAAVGLCAHLRFPS